MEKIILGLLMIRQLTIYELRIAIETNFTSMCSNSMGSIQAAIKKLLEQNMIVYDEFVEHGVNKKVYKLTETGKTNFGEWVQTSMLVGKKKDMELSKLFFMGFAPSDQRLPLIESYLDDLRKEKAKLEAIKRQDMDTSRINQLSYLNEKQEQLPYFLHGSEDQDLQKRIEDVVQYELLTLQFGIDSAEFEINWFESLRDRLVREHTSES